MSRYILDTIECSLLYTNLVRMLFVDASVPSSLSAIAKLPLNANMIMKNIIRKSTNSLVAILNII